MVKSCRSTTVNRCDQGSGQSGQTVQIDLSEVCKSATNLSLEGKIVNMALLHEVGLCSQKTEGTDNVTVRPKTPLAVVWA